MWEVAFHIICKDDASKIGKVFMNTFTNSQICLNQRCRKLKEAWKISLETLDYLDLFFAEQLCKTLIYLTDHLLKLDCVFAWMHAENRRGIRLHRKKSRCYVKVVFLFSVLPITSDSINSEHSNRQNDREKQRWPRGADSHHCNTWMQT